MTRDFTAAAPASELEALAEKLRARNFEVVIVKDGAEAKAEVLKRIPERRAWNDSVFEQDEISMNSFVEGSHTSRS